MNSTAQLSIHTINDTKYSDVTAVFINEPFPVVEIQPKGDIANCVLLAFLASRQVRQESCKPTTESIQVMRAVISEHISSGNPIPVLVPWGPKKPFNTMSLDISEISGLKMLQGLHERVCRWYSPGIEVLLRIDDLSTMHLFALDAGADTAIVKYAKDLEVLISVLGFDFIKPIRESRYTDCSTFMITADNMMNPFVEYLSETDATLEGYELLSSWSKIKNLGWSGSIPKEQRDHFRSLYTKLYEVKNEQGLNAMLARYLAGTLARHALGATAKPVGKKIMQVSFMQNCPGTPVHLNDTKLIYRTTMRNQGHMNFPPWRGLGYLEVRNGSATPKLISPYSEVQTTLTRKLVEMSNGKESVEIELRWKDE